ncbi:MAG: glycosyltransferase, partial [Bacteroidales bacterium]|nr:glycosyltransferase [Bacteroidales bacterium]
EYPDIKLCLTGKVNEDVRSMIKRYIKNENSVLFLGFLDDKKYYSCVKGADILCMPRNNSIHANAGFPFKLAEYLATGKPVITSLASDVSFYLTEDDAFMYNSGDQKTIESYIKLIITDKQEAMRRGRNGQKKAEMCFNNLKVTTDFLTFVRNTCYKE